MVFDRISQLLEDPRFLPAAIVLLLALFSSFRSAKMLIWVFAVFTVLISICPPAIDEDLELPSLNYGLESIRTNNRVIAIMLGGSLLAVTGLNWAGSNALRLPFSGNVLLSLHTLILIKNTLSGYPLTECLLLYMGILIVLFLCWHIAGLDYNKLPPGGVLSYFVPAAVAIFYFTTGIQFFANRSAEMVIGGRFNGLTSNPQMFTICMASIFPCCAYLFFRFKAPAIRACTIAAVLLGLYWCYLTGSRLALLVVVVGFAAYFRDRFTQALAFGSVAVAGLFIASLVIPPEVSAESRIFSLEDTRSAVWTRQWETFLRYPLFGANLRGSRLILAENSWLGVAAGLGIIGLIPMSMLAYRMYQLLLFSFRRSRGNDFDSEGSLLFAIGATSLVASIFEPFLVGILTFPMVLFILSMFLMERNYEYRDMRQLGGAMPNPRRAFSPGVDARSY